MSKLIVNFEKKKMFKFKLVLNSIALGLLMVGTNAYAACITNTGNITTTLASIGSGSCENAVGGVINTSNAEIGIHSVSSGSININSGTIATIDSFSYGIVSLNTNSININSGIITIAGNTTYAIYSLAANTTNNNSGTIITSGSAAHGIASFGANTTNTNSGTVITSGSNAHGIYSSGLDATINNSHLISISGEDSSGIYNSSLGTVTTIDNSGNIRGTATSGGGNRGIFNGNQINLVQNTGVIDLRGAYKGQGLLNGGFGLTASITTINNSGHIYGNFNTGDGISNSGNNTSTINTLINSGIISGDAAISNGGIINHLINSGSIIGNSSGIAGAGSFGTITNTGIIRSNSLAIGIAGNNTVVNLNRGSLIVGEIYTNSSATGNKLNINLGSGVSYAYSVTGPWTVTDLDSRPMVTGSAYAAGIGAQETASEMLYQRTSVITSALDRRLRSYASDEVDNQPYWLDVYYSDVTRNAGGNYSTQTAFSNYNYGITAGFKLPAQFTPLELVVNVEQSNLNIDSGNQKIDSSSIMTGLLAPNIIDVLGAKLSAKALLGYADLNGDRKVMTNSLLYDGSRQIKSDYSSVYAVVGAALTKLYPITDRLTADVILGIDLNTQRFESYKETDYFAWDSRTLTQLHSRIQTGLDYKLWGDKGSVFARVGGEHRDLIGGATQDYSINGTNVSFNTKNKNDTYLTAQVGIKAQLEKRIQLFGVLNTMHSSDSVNSVSGNIGLRADF